MFLHSCADGEDVGVEDDVTGVKPNLVDQKVVGASADLDLSLCVCGLEGRGTLQPPRPIIVSIPFLPLTWDGQASCVL